MRLLKFKDLKEMRIVNSRMTLRRWIDEHNFPCPLHLGPNSVAWDEEEIDGWLKSRATSKKSEAA